MSLIKQLWIGIFVLLLLALGGSFIISIMSAKQYLEEQLRVKNLDNATSLALSMSQMEKDPVTLELLISAQFDTGHYEYITLTNPQKKILVSRHYEDNKNTPSSVNVPLWFTRLVNFDAEPGVAQIQDGWQQFGTLTVKSHSRYAWQALWHSTSQLLTWFVIAAVLSGVVGTLILKFISSPLDTVIKQAEAIGQRRFVTSDEPKTTEFQRLVRAMNALSQSVKAMLEKETHQLEKLRRESQLDPLTELPNRNHFLNLLESKLSRDDSDSAGVIAVVRFLNLAEINNHLGRAAADHALLQIAGVLHQFIDRYPGSHAGRLNGSDFMLVISSNPSAESVGAELSEQLGAQLSDNDLQSVQLPLAVCTYASGEKRNELLHKLDGALAQAELKGNRALIVLNTTGQPVIHRNLSDWRDAITHSLDLKRVQLAQFPVRTPTGSTLHTEAPVRLLLDDEWQPAGYFMPWAARLGIMPSIDLEVIKNALNNNTDSPVAINISAESLCSADFREQAISLLNKSIQKAQHLWLEFPESCALRHMAELRSFTNALRAFGCRVGLEHVGLEFTKIRELQDIGLHYLKIDGAIVRDIDTNSGNQNFLSGLCKIGHSLGMIMIAESVRSAQEKEKLIQLGIDGLTGPGV
ncbi:LapD/MoxY N-terminal periplasmic domain-containing protein [Cellvibrio sp.]|uniref:bifunctional diguanylate cyclase/phosphodiesterase n=1 Tax=Cellvibrio sp. TaxID=1965322 RepID=UPI0039647E08